MHAHGMVFSPSFVRLSKKAGEVSRGIDFKLFGQKCVPQPRIVEMIKIRDRTTTEAILIDISR